ncbi:hypothetical protein EXIGLDRAFT_694447, partial [Exidia glandulosa HHB12029]
MDPAQVSKMLGILSRTHVIRVSLTVSSPIPFQTLNSFTIAGAILFLWEHIITSNEEFDVIWKSSWSLGKVLFLLQRYLVWPELIGALYEFGSGYGIPYSVSMSGDLCLSHLFVPPPVDRSPLKWLLAVATSATISMAHAILLMRTWALWRSNKCVVLALPVALTMFVVFIAYSTSRYVSGTT